MNNKIPYLLRGFVADVRPHGKPTTKMKIANYNKYNKHTGGEGKNRTSLLSGFICHGALSKALRRPSPVEELVLLL